MAITLDTLANSSKDFLKKLDINYDKKIREQIRKELEEEIRREELENAKRMEEQYAKYRVEYDQARRAATYTNGFSYTISGNWLTDDPAPQDVEDVTD